VNPGTFANEARSAAFKPLSEKLKLFGAGKLMFKPVAEAAFPPGKVNMRPLPDGEVKLIPNPAAGNDKVAEAGMAIWIPLPSMLGRFSV